MARATKARVSAHADGPSAGIQMTLRRLDIAVEACWLVAAFLIPLIVLPERSFLSFTSVPKIFALRFLAGIALMLLAARWTLQAWSRPGAIRPIQASMPSAASAWRWATSTPVHTLAAASLAVLAATALSAALSVSPYLSVWGKDPGSDGYGLYNMASYVCLGGLAVATRLRRPAQLWRLLAVIMATGTVAGLIAVMQDYGFSPLDISATSGVRVTGTAGNPIFLGALLVLTIPVSFASLAVLGDRLNFRPRWWALATPVVAVQVAALAFTLSRGPWLGAAAAVAALLGLMWFFAGRRVALTCGALAVSSLVITYAALSAPSLFQHAPPAVAQGVQQRFEGSISSGSVAARAATGPDEIGSGLNGRVIRWSTSAGLAVQRPPIVEGADPGWFVRFLTGYGPDMFRFAFPLTAPADLASMRTDAAHNDHLNRLVELGVLGSIAYIALGTAVAAAIVRLFRAARLARNPAAAIVAAALTAALIGRIVEQVFGIAKPGDLMITWLLVGLAAAAPAAFGLLGAPQEPAQEPAVESRVARHAGQRARTDVRREPSAGQSGGRRARRPAWAGTPALAASPARAALAATAAIAIAALLVLTWTKGVNYLRADHVAMGTTATFSSDPAAGLRQIEAAISLAPDVRDYYHRRSLMLQAVADADPSRSEAFLREAAATDLAAVEMNPMSIDSNLAAAYSSWRVAQTADVQMAVQALALYERLSKLTPQNPLVQTRLESLRSVVKLAPAKP